MMRRSLVKSLGTALFALGVIACKGDENAVNGAAGAPAAVGGMSGAGGSAGSPSTDDPSLPRTGASLVLDAPPLVDDPSVVFEDELAQPSPSDEMVVQQVPGPGAEWTKEEYCTAKVEGEMLWCEYIADCCTVADLSSLFFIPPACATVPTEQDCLLELADLEAVGGVFDGTWAEACLNFDEGNIPWPPNDCSGVGLHDTFYSRHSVASRFQVEACRRMNRGTKALGSACTFRSECQIGSACISAPAGSVNNYECQRPRRATEACDSTADCERGLFCVSDGLVTTCGPLHAAGERCEDAFDCANGLQCVAERCQQPLYLNDPCSASEQCEVQLLCDTNTSQCALAEAAICDGI